MSTEAKNTFDALLSFFLWERSQRLPKRPDEPKVGEGPNISQTRRPPITIRRIYPAEPPTIARRP
jgi:hypothetical protein